MRVAAVFFIISAWGSGIATGSLEFVIYRVLVFIEGTRSFQVLKGLMVLFLAFFELF